MYGTAYNTFQLGFGDVVSIFSFGFNAALFMHNTHNTHTYMIMKYHKHFYLCL